MLQLVFHHILYTESDCVCVHMYLCFAATKSPTHKGGFRKVMNPTLMKSCFALFTWERAFGAFTFCCAGQAGINNPVTAFPMPGIILAAYAHKVEYVKIDDFETSRFLSWIIENRHRLGNKLATWLFWSQRLWHAARTCVRALQKYSDWACCLLFTS